ncbi:angiopoietin-related protein 1-like [Paramormyrops kingsleyae]|uniref:Angiopoietin like 1 n=1 Tax=Paramormyrops kingsleyae TaxID=1676925 RepID=A0A3B3RS26_9TELE|nr:angiopoietin-related protein 1-like [Paramormyrops kingsleyae]XP_023674553.1 angiopoietin-related protein 1-like [Paramormyrops kingsleyae]XP_023674554.1 angiopoietin-related protein 1-like [Paramormyrops kingsleyae]
MRRSAWALCAVLCLSACSGMQGLAGESPARMRRSPEDDRPGKCSYTFLVPEQKITGPICASSMGPVGDKDRVTRMDIADVRDVLSRQQREMEMLRLAADVDGALVSEVKLMRKESRNMNSRVTQLYTQLLHEIIRKRDNALESAQLENRVLNATAEMLRLAARYKELEARFSALAALVNNQSALITALEEQCPRLYGRRTPLVGPPLVQVVPENLPVNTFTNEIQRDHNRAFPRDPGPRMDPPPTVSPFGFAIPPQGNFSSEGPFGDCYQARQAGFTTSGIYLLKADGMEHLMQAWCEHALDNGGWTVIQCRRDGSVNFFRNWDTYKKGFGNIDNEYWLGLENIYSLAKQRDYRLMVELEDWSGKKVYAEYRSFRLEPESEFYRLRLGTYQGNAGDSLSSHNGKPFTTLDRDKDTFSGNCAHFHKGGWWYNACGQTNLNGVWYTGGVYRSKFQDGIFWADYGGGSYSMKGVRMMIRPID